MKTDQHASRGGEPAYKRWATMLTAGVAVASLALNVFLGVSNWSLKREQEEYQARLLRQEATADLEARYLVASGMALLQPPAQLDTSRGQAAVLENAVADDLERWREGWETGDEDLVVTDQGVERSHGMVLLRVSNRGQQDARGIQLVARERAFSQDGERGPYLWELDSTEGELVTFRLADLGPGETLMVPLAHMLGTDYYFGPTYLPTVLRWNNHVIGEMDSIRVQRMAPEDQWIARGLNLKVAQ